MNQTAPQSPAKPSRDRYVKIGFLLLLLAVATFIWLHQKRQPGLAGWETSFDAALAQAKQRDSQVLVLFTSSPMSHEDKRLINETLTGDDVANAFARLGLVKVHLTVKGAPSLASKYQIATTPAVLLTDSTGKETTRQVGMFNKTTLMNMLEAK